MAERYVKLYSLPERQYAQSAPCLLEAGALLKDTQTGSVLAQLKFRSITSKVIKMLKVAVITYDGAGQVLESNAEYQYTGLDVQRDESFGEQVPLVLKNSQAVSFKVAVCEVFFADATTWVCNPDVQLLPLEEQETLTDVFDGDAALVGEYKRKFGRQSCYLPRINGDIWLCACGVVNNKDEENCHQCGSCLQEMRAVSVASLQKEREERLQKEKEEQEQREEELLAKKKKRNKILAITLSIICLAVAVIIILDTVILPPIRYNAQLESLKNVSVGDEVKFGYYEQENGEDEIEWQVLDVEDSKALLISKYSLDCQPYNEADEEVTWETCTLRKWLNTDFYNTAFDEKYQEGIVQTVVTADKNSSYDTNPGNATEDNIFLLSIAEAEKYFSFDEERQCQATAYAEEQGAGVYKRNGNCWWWLRSPGIRGNYAAFVHSGGSIYDSGSDVSSGSSAVRPAMWVKID